jgi:hypothetical protein
MSDEPKEPRIYGTHPGDLGVIALAMLCTYGFLFLMFDPAPLKGLDKYEEVVMKTRKAEIAKAEKQKHDAELKAAIASGVVMVGIIPPKH